MTDGVGRMRPEQIAAAVLEAMRNAQSRYPAELARIMGETVGDDATTRHILAEAERNFPAASGDPAQPRPSTPPEGGDEFGDDSIFR